MTEDQNIFSPVQSERVSQLIEEQIKEAIIKRHYLSGDKLPPERELARMFGASRSSIREAVRSLERSGFVEVKKGVQGGAYVIKKGDPKPMVNYVRDMLRLREVDLMDVLEARLLIEPGVAAEAARKATPEDIERLKEVTFHQQEGFDTANPVMQYDRNPRFHSIIAEITGNQVLIILTQILMEIHAFRMNRFKLDEETIKEITRHHQDIIDAIKDKDTAMAFEKMKNHVLSVHAMHERLEQTEQNQD